MPDAKTFLGARSHIRIAWPIALVTPTSSFRQCRFVCGTDVDDLTEGKGAEFVDASVVMLVFVSSG
eukprot:5949045-Prymnesium_polylepis.1